MRYNVHVEKTCPCLKIEGPEDVKKSSAAMLS